METMFAVGQQVEAQADSQGLEVGAVYTIVGKSARVYAFGTFVEYELGREGRAGTLIVRNAHLLLSAVCS